MNFEFRPTIGEPPRWLGPFSPATGTHSGIRVRNRWIGAWWTSGDLQSFWWMPKSPGAHALASYVLTRYGGGRVLLLPDGKVIKPLQDDEVVGIRVLIGKFDGPVQFTSHTSEVFDCSRRGHLRPGDPWGGPAHIGVACQLKADGSLWGRWYHPTSWGRDTVSVALVGPDQGLALGFRAARPGQSSGKVIVTPNGIVITNVMDDDGWMRPSYVGWSDPQRWPRHFQWIEKMIA